MPRTVEMGQKQSSDDGLMKILVAAMPREPLGLLVWLWEEFATFHRVSCRVVRPQSRPFFSSVRRKTRAYVQARSAVRGEIPRAAAALAEVSPAKNRNLTNSA